MSIGNIEWPHLLADITAKRDALNQVIETLTKHFIKDGDDEPPARPVSRRGKPGPKPRRSKKLLRGRKQSSRQRAVRGLPDHAVQEPP